MVNNRRLLYWSHPVGTTLAVLFIGKRDEQGAWISGNWLFCFHINKSEIVVSFLGWHKRFRRRLSTTLN